MVQKIAFVVAVGVGKTLDKTGFLIESIQRYHPDSEIYAFVAEEELEKGLVSQDYCDFLEDTGTNVLYGEIPMEEYIFTVKHNALIKASKKSSSDYFCVLDSDMLMLDKFYLPKQHDMFVCKVDIGNTSWGREESRPYWEELYNEAGVPMPTYKLYPLADSYRMFPFYNGGLVITNNKNFGEEWLTLTSRVFKKIEKWDSYNKFRSRSKRRRFFQRIPYSHWTEQVTLTLLSQKYKAHVLPYDYNYPINIMRRCPSETKLVHYHDFRNLWKMEKRLSPDLRRYLYHNYSRVGSTVRMNIYAMMRRAKITLGKF